MLTDLYNTLIGRSQSAGVIIIIAVMLFCGFAMTRLTKLLKLPNVTAYIIAGILIGPYCFNLIPTEMTEGTAFLPDIALAFIAFGTGEYFRFSALRKSGMKSLVITVFESCAASLLVFILTFYVLDIDLSFSVVLAALAAATAPASTMMTIRQTGAKGDFVTTLLQVVALDDVVGLIAYSVAISVAVAARSGGTIDIKNIAVPLITNMGVLLLGCGFGVILKLLMPKKRSTDNRLIISVSVLFAFCGICSVLDVSPLLGCMSMSTVYINITDDDKLFKQLNYFSPPILLLFFVRSGVSFDLHALISTAETVGSSPLLLVGIVYFAARLVGKYTGAYTGCLLARKPAAVRNYLGLALAPQAGVAIGLAALGARTLGGNSGQALQTIILASSVLYEIIGPACAKLALYLSKSYISSDRMAQAEEQGEQPEEQEAFSDAADSCVT